MFKTRDKSGGIKFTNTSEENHQKRLIERIKFLERTNMELMNRIEKVEKLLDCLSGDK